MTTLAALDVRCAVTDLPAPSCAHCLKLPDPDVVYSIARARSLCRGCGEPIYPGDTIHRNASSRFWFGDCCD